jgi:hypothetical protein
MIQYAYLVIEGPHEVEFIVSRYIRSLHGKIEPRSIPLEKLAAL